MTTIILSKDRPAQLDLLLRSIERNGGEQFEVTVLMGGSHLLFDLDRAACWMNETDFEDDVHYQLSEASEFVCFMCDDGLLYRHVPPLELDGWPDDLLCLSLRYGENTTIQYPTLMPNDFGQEIGVGDTFLSWEWRKAHGDFGYPGSIDAHVFRTADVLEMLDGQAFPNPTALECVLADRCIWLADRRPLMACFPHSLYVGIPVNRVSSQSNVRHGAEFPLDPAEATRRFQAGERLNLDVAIAEANARVVGAHTEIPLAWT